MPWTGDHPDYPYMGFKLESLDPELPTVYLYLHPEVADESRPLLGLYVGEYGDHTKDHRMGGVEGRQQGETDE